MPDLLFSYTIKPVLYGSLAAWAAGIGSICSLFPGLGYLFTEKKGVKYQVLNLSLIHIYVHLTVLSETGLPGYAVFLVLWFCGIAMGIYWGLSKFNNCKDRLILRSSGVLLACLLFHQFFEGNLMRICALHFLWVYLIAVIAMLSGKIKSKAGINQWNLKE